jgi:hypothetical protein
MRFVMMEHLLPPEEVLTFLQSLADTLAVRTAQLKQYVAAADSLAAIRVSPSTTGLPSIALASAGPSRRSRRCRLIRSVLRRLTCDIPPPPTPC